MKPHDRKTERNIDDSMVVNNEIVLDSDAAIVGVGPVSQSDIMFQTEESLAPSQSLICAGFWRRTAALIIDEILLGILVNGPVLLSVQSIILFRRAQSDLHSAAPSVAQDWLMWASYFVISAVSLSLPCFYFAFLESSSRQASIGKRLMQLKVVDAAGARMGFWRCVWKWIIQCFLWLPFLIAAAVCFVFFKSPWISLVWGLLYFLVGYGFLWWNSGRQTLFDKMTGRFVILSKGEHTGSAKGSSPYSKLSMNAAETVTAMSLCLTLVLMAGTIYLNFGKYSLEVSSSLLDLSSLENNRTGICLQATRPMKVGHVITANDLRVIKPGILRTPISSLSSPDKLIGRRLSRDIDAGDIILQGQYFDKSLPITGVLGERDLTADELFTVRIHRCDEMMRDINMDSKSPYLITRVQQARAWTYAEHGDWQMALTWYDKATSWRPTEPDIQVGRARCYAGLKQYSQALSALKMVFDSEEGLSPELLSEAYSVRGQIREALSQHGLAQEDLAHARKLKTQLEIEKLLKTADELNSFAAHEIDENYNLADPALIYGKSLKYCDQAVSLDPQNAEAHLLRANTYAGLKKWNAVIDDSDKVIQTNDQSIMADAYTLRAKAYREMGNMSKARSDERTAERLRREGQFSGEN